MSCRNEMSPTSRVTPLLRPKANPAALLSTPSIPLAPLLAATGAPSPEGTCIQTEFMLQVLHTFVPMFQPTCCALSMQPAMSMALKRPFIPSKLPFQHRQRPGDDVLLVGAWTS